eukprot:1719651-Rhodomonas_salina.1
MVQKALKSWSRDYAHLNPRFSEPGRAPGLCDWQSAESDQLQPQRDKSRITFGLLLDYAPKSNTRNHIPGTECSELT